MARPIIVAINNDPAFLDALCLTVEDEGYQCLPHPGEVGAITLARQVQPALIVLDIRMEQPRSGQQVLGELRADSATAAIPVLVCTVDATFLKDETAPLQEQGVAVIAKPFDIDDLLATVTRLTMPSAVGDIVAS